MEKDSEVVSDHAHLAMSAMTEDGQGHWEVHKRLLGSFWAG